MGQDCTTVSNVVDLSFVLIFKIIVAEGGDCVTLSLMKFKCFQ